MKKIKTLTAALLSTAFALNLQAQQVMTVDLSKPVAKIQPAMYGIFFEDINFGADGGLYAELVKNRSFEFPQPFVGWVPFGDVSIASESPCFDRNPHYARIINDGRRTRAGLDNEGFKGIGLKAGEEYRFSVYARTPENKPMKLSVQFVNSTNDNLLKKEFEITGDEW
ncbi:MAG: carbohydrate binding domain-containing protein, partial [Bacteroides sp.]|nr:carbohydrate binding domain-containing protein [Bacteroides sp.]